MADTLIEGLAEHYNVGDLIPRRIKMMTSIFLQTPVIDLKTLQAYKTPEPKTPKADISITGE